ncbi:Cytochrome P450 [Apiospora hydei]|uniref:Cytochrome P450 n=1 Tax=Apiospora hydei TaxID=1337664 RepID=A0ABR1UXI9_9PEZI
MLQAVLWALTLIAASCLARAVYNVYLHPLRGYPGPLLCRATFLTWMLVQCRGESTNFVHAQHKRYGPVVRLEPNLLSYNDGQAWRDIYGHKTGANSTTVGNLPKPPYAVRTNPNGYSDIINVPTEHGHRRMRKLMTHMFSAAALAGQEPLIRGYVDKLVATLQSRAGEPLDIGLCFACTTFDVLGALAFGKDFGGLETGELHPWVTNIFGSIKQSYLQRILNRFPWPLNRIAYRIVVDDELSQARKAEFNFATERARERLERGITMEKHDFMSYMLKYNDEKGMSEGEIMSNSSILIIAGGETSAVYLSGIIYHMLCKPSVMEKLAGIIRSTFKSEDEITFNALSEIEYLSAVIQEGGRTYAPVPSGLPRVATKGGSLILDRHVPEGTVAYVHAMAANLSPANFADPEDFVPERWLKQPPAKYADDHLEATQAFSLGPRGCIGRNLAMAEMRLILARVLWNFDIKLCDESKGWKESQKTYNVWDKTPLMVILTPRVPHFSD